MTKLREVDEASRRTTKLPNMREALPRAKRAYRIVVLRKLIDEERGQRCIGSDFRYFFYVTNDRKLTQAEVVAEAGSRCNQENLIAQLKNGVRALHAPLNTLEANWAYMVIASLAWTIKAWAAQLDADAVGPDARARSST